MSNGACHGRHHSHHPSHKEAMYLTFEEWTRHLSTQACVRFWPALLSSKGLRSKLRRAASSGNPRDSEPGPSPFFLRGDTEGLGLFRIRLTSAASACGDSRNRAVTSGLANLS